jgi:hypothetical protein
MNPNEYRNVKQNVERIEKFFLEKGITFEDIQKKLIDKVGFDHYENDMISKINELTFQVDESKNDEILELENLSFAEIEAKMLLNRNNAVNFLFYYHYLSAVDAYNVMFKNFRNVVSDPMYFFAGLIDIFRLDFNVELFFTTKSYEGCKGFIFNLANGVSHNEKMGIVLTPLALQSAQEFLSTIFHELIHRLYFVRLDYQNDTRDKIGHEFYTYFVDKFIYKFFKRDVGDLDWLDKILKMNPLGMAEEILKTENDFMEKIAISFNDDIDNIYNSYINRPDTTNIYDAKSFENMYERAKQINSIPKNYGSMIDFLWFYSSKISVLHKMGHIPFYQVILNPFILLIIFSKKYENKYCGKTHTRYSNIVFNCIGTMTSEEVEFTNLYCSDLIKNFNHDLQ